MKKIVGSFVCLALCGSLNAQNISVEESKWKLVGATENITNMAVFNASCVNTVWKYDNGWKAYSADSSTLATLKSAIGDSNVASSINMGEGFWINGNNSCTVDTTKAVESTSTYTLASNDVSGKTFTVDGNNNEGWVTFVFNSDGTGTETGYNQDGSLDYATESITWNVSNNKLNITLTSDSSTAYMTFNAQPANTVTGTYVGYGENMNIDISNFADNITIDLPADNLYESWGFTMNSYTDMKNGFLSTPIANYFSYGDSEYMFGTSNNTMCYSVKNNDTYNTRSRGECSSSIGTWTESSDTMIATLANGDKAYFKVLNGSVAQYKPNDY